MTYWNDTQIQIIWNENRKQRQKQEIIDHPNDFKVIYISINNILFQTQVESKISIFQKKNIKKRTFKITFIYSLYLETIQYLCRFHMLKVPPWKVPLRLYSSHVFTAGLQLEVWGPLTLCGLGVFGVCGDALLVWNSHDGLDRHGAFGHGFCWVSVQVSWGWKMNDITIILKATETNIVKSNIITGGWIINRLPVPIISTKFFFLNIMIKNCIL